MINNWYSHQKKLTVLESDDADVPEYYVSLLKSPILKRKLQEFGRRKEKQQKISQTTVKRRTPLRHKPQYKINLADLHKKALKKKMHNKPKTPEEYNNVRPVPVYKTPLKERSRIMDNFNTDLHDFKEETAMHINSINNTIQSKNIHVKEVEMVKLKPKDADSDLISSSSQVSNLEYIPPPQVEMDEYKNAFKEINMGPHSKSFVTFTPCVETKPNRQVSLSPK